MAKASDLRLRIGLVQIGNSFAGACYFPYSAGLLMAYVQAKAADPSRYEFLPVIHRRERVRDAARALAGASVAAFSVYVWNHNLSLAIARELKAMSPETLVVFGGPHVPDKAEDYLRDHPFIDVACHGEGERPFLALMETLAAGGRDFSAVPSVTWRDGLELRANERGPRLTDLGDVPSPYLSGAFEGLIDREPDHMWLGVWETNRGCPFSCAYCDWGSANASKVHLFPMDRLEREIEWFAKKQVEFIFCCDGNFGMFKRDLDISRMVAGVKARLGYPKALSVQNTKNAAERSFEVQRILAEAGLNKGVTLAMQTVNPEALKAVGRENISPDAFKELQRRFRDAQVETYTDIILALPGETYRSFAEGTSQIVAGGQHNRIQFINLSILPNARMGDPAYRREHGMVTVDSRIINIHGAMSEKEEVEEVQTLVVGTSAMPPADWLRARAFSWMASLLYFDKLLQIPMLLIQEQTGTPCHELVEAFMDLPGDEFPILAGVWAFFTEQAAVVAAGGEEYYPGPDCLGIYWPHDEYQFIRLSRDDGMDAFYAEAETVLVRTLGRRGLDVPDFLGDALAMNRALISRPFAEGDLTLELGHDIYDAYRRALAGQAPDVQARPSRYVVDRTSARFDSWDAWMREVVWWGNKKGAYFYRLARQ